MGDQERADVGYFWSGRPWSVRHWMRRFMSTDRSLACFGSEAIGRYLFLTLTMQESQVRVSRTPAEQSGSVIQSNYPSTGTCRSGRLRHHFRHGDDALEADTPVCSKSDLMETIAAVTKRTRKQQCDTNIADPRGAVSTYHRIFFPVCALIKYVWCSWVKDTECYKGCTLVSEFTFCYITHRLNHV